MSPKNGKFQLAPSVLQIAVMTELSLNTMAMNNIPVKSTGLYTQWL
jgi:hypothetical protein